MSIWTYIVAAIEIETYIEDKNICDRVMEMLKNAPKITGSEHNADIFVNVLSGHNIWTNCDCKHCQYYETIVNTEEGFYCDSPEWYKCPEGEYQTQVVITIVGSLRDREEDTTRKEFKEFIKFLRKDCNFDIDGICVKIR